VRKDVVKKNPGIIVLLMLLGVFLVTPVFATPTQTLITTGPGAAEFPHIFGDQIVWQDYRNENLDIYLYNLTTGTETQITNDPADQMSPRIYHDLIVWEDHTNPFYPSIYLYNVTTHGPIVQVSDGTSSQTSPSVYGSLIVWSDDRGSTPAIFMNGTTSGSETPLSPGAVAQGYPAIYDNLVVWTEDPGIGDQNIYLYNLTSRLKTQITTDPHDQTNAAIYGNRIVWEDNRNGGDEIFINGTGPGEEYSLSPGQPGIDHRTPAISGTKVVWTQENSSAGGWDLVLNETTTASSSPIVVSPVSSKQQPAIFTDTLYGDRVVWRDDRSGHYQVYLYSSTGPGTCPVASFNSDFTGGSAPKTVRFTDTTPAGSTHWFWDFGDGSSSTERIPDHTYTANNPYTVTLTVSNPWCRNATTRADYVILGRPVANFIASPTSDIVPATISFTDTSGGNPDTWNWSFGDNSWLNTTDPVRKNAVHVYTTPGTYAVSLTVNNTYGSDTRTRSNYIMAFKGVNEKANTTIDGLTITNCGGPQTITVDSSVVFASLTPNSSVLEVQPPKDRGFENITVFALDGTGFTSDGTKITGRVTGVHLQTKEIVPTGFSPATGPVSVNYSIDLPLYPCDAMLNTRIWEGTIPSDRDKFERIAIGSTFAHWLGTLYTTKITKTNFPDAGTAKIHMSAGSAWVAKEGGPGQIYVEHILDDGLLGEVLRTRYLSYDPSQNLYYFEADSPRGMSTFGLSALSGSGNPLQLITLTVTSHASQSEQSNYQPPADSDSNAGVAAGAGKIANQPGTPAPVITQATVTEDPGTSAKIYASPNGVITQATRLRSTDSHAIINITEGVVAKNASGNPLSEITVKAIPSGSLPPVPSGSAGTFAGLAYDLGPDGASFSPPVSLSFSLPQAQSDQDYVVKSFDQKSGTWEDLPTSFDAATGTVTAHLSHFCVFALFSRPRAAPVTTPAATPLPVPTTLPVKAQPPTTAVSIFSSMMAWAAGLVMNNAVIVVAVIILAIAVYLVMQRRFPGSGR
jgi:beta propeller repeat protein